MYPLSWFHPAGQILDGKTIGQGSVHSKSDFTFFVLFAASFSSAYAIVAQMLFLELSLRNGLLL